MLFNMVSNALLNLVLLFLLFTGGYSTVLFIYQNECEETLWLGARPFYGFTDPQIEKRVPAYSLKSEPWTGSIWARTRCSTSISAGSFICETGDCGQGKLVCNNSSPNFPITLMNFSIDNDEVSYELSLLHGHNVGIRIEPDGGTLVEGGSCPYVDCSGNIGEVCPPPLKFYKDARYIGCYSACDAQDYPKYCCTQQPCLPTEYTQQFKDMCPLAHTFPGDTPPVYRCKGAKSYNITFCPS